MLQLKTQILVLIAFLLDFLLVAEAGKCDLVHWKGMFGGSVHMRNAADNTGRNNTCHWSLTRATNYDRMRLVVRHVRMSGYSEVVIRSGATGPVVMYITPTKPVTQSVLDSNGQQYGITINTVNGSLNDLYFSFLSYNEIRATGECPIYEKEVNEMDFTCSHICINEQLRCDKTVNCPNGLDESRRICPSNVTSSSAPIIVSLFVVLLVIIAVIVAYMCVKKMRSDQGFTENPWTVFSYKIFKNSPEGGTLESNRDLSV